MLINFPKVLNFQIYFYFEFKFYRNNNVATRINEHYKDSKIILMYY